MDTPDDAITPFDSLWSEVIGERVKAGLQGEALWASFSREELLRVRAASLAYVKAYPNLRERLEAYAEKADRLLAAKAAI